MIGLDLIFLQVFDQIWLLQTFMVMKKSRMAILVLRAKLEKLVSKLRITEKMIMKNCSRATDMITKLIAVAWTFLLHTCKSVRSLQNSQTNMKCIMH